MLANACCCTSVTKVLTLLKRRQRNTAAEWEKTSSTRLWRASEMCVRWSAEIEIPPTTERGTLLQTFLLITRGADCVCESERFRCYRLLWAFKGHQNHRFARNCFVNELLSPMCALVEHFLGWATTAPWKSRKKRGTVSTRRIYLVGLDSQNWWHQQSAHCCTRNNDLRGAEAVRKLHTFGLPGCDL